MLYRSALSLINAFLLPDSCTVIGKVIVIVSYIFHNLRISKLTSRRKQYLTIQADDH